MPSKYDRAIKRAALISLPFTDWRLYKAQLIQESRLDPNAISPAGAKGIAQFMPGTWREYQSAKQTQQSPFSASDSIRAGAWYMSKMRRTWSSPRPEQDRYSLALASYNRGARYMGNAQRKCGGVLLYAEIIKCVPIKETREYAPRIWRHYFNLLFGS